MGSPEAYFSTKVFGAVTAISPISGGLSGKEVFAVTTDRGEYVLHLHGPRREMFSEIVAAQRHAAKSGIAPVVIFADQETGAVISEKINGVSLGAVLGHSEMRSVVLGKVAETLTLLHSIPASDVSLADPSLGRSIWDQQSARDGFPDWARRMGTYVSLGENALANDGRRVFSHNDLNPGNLLWDGSKLWMVDWERASLAHPYIDLAMFSVFAILSDNDAVKLLEKQEQGDISDQQRITFLSILNYIRAIYGAVFFRLIPQLTEVEFASWDDTLSLSQCYARLAKGELNLSVPKEQALFGCAILRQAEIPPL
jgi:aminoglycoside phosphotransferase (APT) family kinase protein